MKKIMLSICFSLFVAISANAQNNDKEPDHDDKAHEKAEKNLNDSHWNDAHGSGTTKNETPTRKPGSNTTEQQSNNAVQPSSGSGKKESTAKGKAQ